MLILFPNIHHSLSHDIESLYRQQSDFLYWTQISSPDCRAIVITQRNSIWHEQCLDRFFFVSIRDEKKILREWKKIDQEYITTLHPDAHVFPLSEWDSLLPTIIQQYPDEIIYHNCELLNTDKLSFCKNTNSYLDQMENLKYIVNRDISPLDSNRFYRAVKSDEEIEKISKAQKITLEAIDYAVSHIHPGMYEYEIAAKLSYYYAKLGYSDAFRPIVASGKNACTLHYTTNDSIIQSWDIILIDTGVIIEWYCGDCSRSVFCPLSEKDVENEKGSDENKNDYEMKKILLAIVQSVYNSCLSFVKPWISLKQLHQYAWECFEILFIEYWLERKAEYFPHAIWHSIGLDVHDPLDKDRLLEPGMCITIEPWIYIATSWIGIRWEDIVIVDEIWCQLVSKSN